MQNSSDPSYDTSSLAEPVATCLANKQNWVCESATLKTIFSVVVPEHLWVVLTMSPGS